MIVSAERTSTHRPGCPGSIRLGARDLTSDPLNGLRDLMMLTQCAQNNTNGGRSHLFLGMDFEMPGLCSTSHHCATREQC